MPAPRRVQSQPAHLQTIKRQLQSHLEQQEKDSQLGQLLDRFDVAEEPVMDKRQISCSSMHGWRKNEPANSASHALHEACMYGRSWMLHRRLTQASPG